MKTLIAGLVIGLAAGIASADQWTFDVALDGLQEVPPVATPGYGSATATFDDVSGAIAITGSFHALIGTTNNAHLHGYAGPGVNAGAIFPLAFDIGVTDGSFSGNGVIPAGNIADVLNGLTYINIHTTFKTGGEIRGQLTNPTRVPEPASVGLLGGAAGLGLLRRRR